MASPTTLRDHEALDLSWILDPHTPDYRSDPDWSSRSRCSETDPEAYFPDKGESSRQAAKTCGNCEVRAQCLTWALANDERFGVWGGHPEAGRRRMRRVLSELDQPTDDDTAGDTK